MNLALDSNITTERKLHYSEKFTHRISIKKYVVITYNLFTATLNNSRQVQKEIWKKALELKSQLGVYSESYAEDECSFTSHWP